MGNFYIIMIIVTFIGLMIWWYNTDSIYFEFCDNKTLDAMIASLLAMDISFIWFVVPLFALIFFPAKWLGESKQEHLEKKRQYNIKAKHL